MFLYQLLRHTRQSILCGRQLKQTKIEYEELLRKLEKHNKVMHNTTH